MQAYQEQSSTSTIIEPNYYNNNYFSSSIPKPSFYPNQYWSNQNNSSTETSFDSSFNSSSQHLSSSPGYSYTPQYSFNQSYSPTNYFNYYNYTNYYYNQPQNSSIDSAYQTQSSINLSTPLNQPTTQIINLTNSQGNFINKKRKRCQDDNQCEKENISIQESPNENNCQTKRPKVLKLANCMSNDVEYKCQSCPNVFYSAAKLLMHEFVHHKKGNSKQCPICYRNFGSNSNAMVHLRGHTQEKLYQCNQCDKSFVDISTLKKHKRTHSGEKPYECGVCLKKFSQSGNLSRHLLTHRKEDDSTQDNQTVKSGTSLNSMNQIQHFVSNENITNQQADSVETNGYYQYNYQTNQTPSLNYYSNQFQQNFY